MIILIVILSSLCFVIPYHAVGMLLPVTSEISLISTERAVLANTKKKKFREPSGNQAKEPADNAKRST